MNVDGMTPGQVAALIADHLPPVSGMQRQLVALAGPPGSGKSTVAEALVTELSGRGCAAGLLPMDGFHLDNGILRDRGLLPRKGAPETFDVAGFASTVRRLQQDAHVYVPVFDRSRELAISSAREIVADQRVVVVEGNYLLLDQEPWRALTGLWRFSVFLDVAFKVLERRLIARWLDQGLPEDVARARALSNDIPNARMVLDHVADGVDMRLSTNC